MLNEFKASVGLSTIGSPGKLNDVFKKNINFSENQIKSYFENNKDQYQETYKSIKLIELTPKKLIGNDDFNDNFFKKIDEIHYRSPNPCP